MSKHMMIMIFHLNMFRILIVQAVSITAAGGELLHPLVQGQRGSGLGGLRCAGCAAGRFRWGRNGSTSAGAGSAADLCHVAMAPAEGRIYCRGMRLLSFSVHTA